MIYFKRSALLFFFFFVEISFNSVRNNFVRDSSEHDHGPTIYLPMYNGEENRNFFVINIFKRFLNIPTKYYVWYGSLEPFRPGTVTTTNTPVSVRLPKRGVAHDREIPRRRIYQLMNSYFLF